MSFVSIGVDFHPLFLSTEDFVSMFVLSSAPLLADCGVVVDSDSSYSDSSDSDSSSFSSSSSPQSNGS